MCNNVILRSTVNACHYMSIDSIPCQCWTLHLTENIFTVLECWREEEADEKKTYYIFWKCHCKKKTTLNLNEVYLLHGWDGDICRLHHFVGREIGVKNSMHIGNSENWAQHILHLFFCYDWIVFVYIPMENKSKNDVIPLPVY